MLQRLLLSALCAALLLGSPALAQTASGVPPTYGTPGSLSRAGAMSVVGLENGTGAICLIGSDTTCQLPPGTGGGGGGPVTGAAGSFVDGWSVTGGSTTDTACLTDNGTCSQIALLKRENQRLTSLITAVGSPLQAGGSVGNTGFNALQGGSANSAANPFYVNAPVSPLVANPSSTLTLTSTTTAYTAGQLIANNATAGSITVPSFAIANSGGGVSISRLRLSTNDSTSTAWGGQTIQVDLWSAAPTFTNGDRGTWSPATGTGSHLATFSCTMSTEYGDGAYASCAPAVGSQVLIQLASGTAIYWTLQAVSGSGVTGASKVFTLVAEDLN
jgi:hypothetical protein